MSSLIPGEFIDDLLIRTDIIDIVSEAISLKKAGKNYVSCCPFHQEKTPSFTVNQEKQFYYCFGCGAAGNVISFVTQHHKLSFPDAIEMLAHKLNLTVPESQSEQEKARQKKLKPLHELLQTASLFYEKQLTQDKNQDTVQNYLIKRGLTESTIKTFSIGFAPPGWNNLLNYAKKLSWTEMQLEESGLILQSEKHKTFYDRFRKRIIFPIKDLKGYVIGFGGRALDDKKPKYLNSPETLVFHKSQTLYGLYEAKKSQHTFEQLILVEGYMDVITLVQHGINNVVATLGTATTPAHINQLFRYTREIVFCFDGDTAGRQAAHKAMKVTLPLMENGRQIRFLFLATGEDPDSFVFSKGANVFRQLLQQATTFDEYLFSTLESSYDMQTLDGKAAFARQATYYAKQIPDHLYRELFIHGIAKRTELSGDIIHDLMTPASTKEKNTTTQISSANPFSSTITGSKSYQHPPVKTQRSDFFKIKVNSARLAMRILLKYPSLAMKVSTDELSEDDAYDTQLLLTLIKFLQNTSEQSPSAIRGSWHNTILGEKMAEIQLLDLPESDPEETLIGAVNKIVVKIKEQQRSSLKGRSRLEAATKAQIALKQKKAHHNQN